MSYEVVFAPTARREMSAVPERVIPAIIKFVYGDLAANPHRVGKPLKRELAGSFSARRGNYRICTTSMTNKIECRFSASRIGRTFTEPPEAGPKETLDTYSDLFDQNWTSSP